MQFLLVMEVLSDLIHKVESWSLLLPLVTKPVPHQASIYADDLVMFVAPRPHDIKVTQALLSLFESVSGLGCNVVKCQLVPIRCMEEQVTSAISIVPWQRVEVPITYLGLPLSVTKLPRNAFQPLVDHASDRLPAWKGCLRKAHRRHKSEMIL
jgi:hypothetical protein